MLLAVKIHWIHWIHVRRNKARVSQIEESVNGSNTVLKESYTLLHALLTLHIQEDRSDLPVTTAYARARY